MPKLDPQLQMLKSYLRIKTEINFDDLNILMEKVNKLKDLKKKISFWNKDISKETQDQLNSIFFNFVDSGGKVDQTDKLPELISDYRKFKNRLNSYVEINEEVYQLLERVCSSLSLELREKLESNIKALLE